MNKAGDNIIDGDKLPEKKLDEILANILPHEVDDILAEATLEGSWPVVEMMYRKFPRKAPTVKIGDSIGTALHVAVELAEEKVVEELVKIIVDEHKEDARRSKIPAALLEKNDHGATPLHVAASRGLARICRCIVGKNGERVDLVRMENNAGETPLFLAAVTGNKIAFAYLARSSESIVTRVDLVRKDGDSILHLTIRRDYFDLAIIIMHYYSYLGMDANNKGMTPLAVLATRPTAFRSGSRLSWWRLILYRCVHVEPLDVDAMMNSLLSKIEQPQGGKEFPMNYDTICSFLKLFKATLFGILSPHGPLEDQHDAENPEHPSTKQKKEDTPEDPQSGTAKQKTEGPPQRGTTERKTEEPKAKGGTTPKKTILPPSYATFQQFVRFAYVQALGVTGVALREISKTKTKHRRSAQLLEALMEKPYEAFTGTGGQPPSFDADIYRAYLDTDGNESEPDIPGQRDHPETSLTPSPSTKPPLEAQSLKKSEGAKPSKAKKTKSQKDSSESAESSGASETDEGKIDSSDSEGAKNNKPDDKTKSPFLLAARSGIAEMVTMIFSKLPSAIHDTTDRKKKNVLLVAVSNRQTLVVKELMKLKPELLHNLTHALDVDENTVLHLAAQAQGEEKSWQIAGSALQMMWDIKWYEYIRDIAPSHFIFRSNEKEETAGEIFKKSHKHLVEQSSTWLKETSESCSVVAALVAGVSFATAGAVPGGTDNGRPILEGQPAFDAFAVSSLIGLCFSVTGLIMFLAILTSRKEARDFRRGLPFKLLLGLSSLFVSIVAMFVSFCTGHFFIINHKYRRILFPFYAATSLPVAFYALAQFPLYFDLLTAILTKVPRGRDRVQHL